MTVLSKCKAGILAVALLAGANAGTATAAPLQELTIGMGSGSLVGGSARVVKEMGLFEKQGLDVKLVITDSGAVSLAALIGGSYKIVVCGFSELISAKAKGPDLVGIVPTYVGLGVNLVVAKDVAAKLNVPRNAPWQQRLKALDGIVIGTTGPTTVSTISLKAAAESVGANIRFAYMAYPAMNPALANGAIQGFIAAAPFWAQAIVADKAVEWVNVRVELPEQFVPSMSAVLATRRDVAKAEPELVEKVAAAFADLTKAVAERPNEVKAALAKVYPDLNGPTLDLLFEGEAKQWKSAFVTAEQVRHEIAYFKNSGVGSPDIEKVDPKSVLFK